ncbi:Mis12 domain-containing protein [Myriangium duriaei CBS 260.36]|uniref:Mis12 domain-containing protein n=1 Tax=Myriangium duriaei CBS 260.36 TaxID=1168546 RepID=A0A9P4IV33_9PEZI|nr:Mis12 domain-containing protein [Myriangium duriaei CBS 260.36]
MPSPDQIKTALLTEHFRYTPLTLLDDIINTVNELVFQAVNEIEDSLLNTDSETLGFTKAEGVSDADFDAIARTEVEAGIVQLESLLNSTIDKNFDKLEIYTLRNLLTVSNVKQDEGLENWVMLDHYREMDQADHKPVDDSTLDALTALRKRAQETEKLHRALKAEVARNEALLARLRPIGIEAQSTRQSTGSIDQSFASASVVAAQDQPSFSFLSSTPAASELEIVAKRESQPLTQNTKFTLTQLTALKRLLDDLRPHLANFPRPGLGSEAHKTRDAYIESQTRNAMARNGIEPGKSQGGVALTAGRAVSAEEVKALEAMAGALGGESHPDRMEE